MGQLKNGRESSGKQFLLMANCLAKIWLSYCHIQWHVKCRFWYYVTMKSQKVKRGSSKFCGDELIWFVLLDLLFMFLAADAIVLLLNMHSNLYKATLSFDQIVILTFLFVIPLVSAVCGCFAFREGRRYIFLLQVFCCVVFYWSAFIVRAFINLAKAPAFVGSDRSGVVSDYEAYFILYLITFGMVFLNYACGRLGMVEVLWKVVGGISIVIGILLPGMLETHKLLWAKWNDVAQSLDVSYDGLRSDISFSEMSIEFSVAFAVVCLLYLFFAPAVIAQGAEHVRLKEDSFLFGDGATPAQSENVSVNSTVLPASLSALRGNAHERVEPVWSLGDMANSGTAVVSSGVLHRSADHAAMPSRLEDARSSSSVSAGSSGGFRSVAVPTRLMGAAVSGLVAGACFSVVNRLFSRH